MKSHFLRIFLIRSANLMHNMGWKVIFTGDEENTDIPAGVMRRRIHRISQYLEVKSIREHNLCRVGAQADGGYVMVENFSDIDGVLSLGVGPDVSWDEDIAKYTDVIHLYDHSVDELPVPIKNSTWFKEKIVIKNDLTGTTLATAVSRLPASNKLILKCDIEDAEWSVIAEASQELLEKFDQIVIEFHWIINHLYSADFETMLNALEKLSLSHSVVNIHANNYANYKIIANCPIPDVLEVSYVRTNSYKFNEKAHLINFNVPNYEKNPEISLQFPIT